jgi:hypothetical protein
LRPCRGDECLPLRGVEVKCIGQQANGAEMRLAAESAFQIADSPQAHPGAFSEIFLREGGGHP